MRTASPSTTDESFLVFGLADRTYAIPIKYVAEIAPMAELSQVPGSPNFLSGFLNVAGQLIGVISLRRLFGLPDCERHLYSPLVLLKSLSQPIALEVDTGLQIAKIKRNDLMPLDEASSVNNCAAAIVRIDGSSVVVLSVNDLLLEQERKRVAELAHLAGQRLDHMGLVTA
jgi:purine-binding chemotaxis protein CheW